MNNPPFLVTGIKIGMHVSILVPIFNTTNDINYKQNMRMLVLEMVTRQVRIEH